MKPCKYLIERLAQVTAMKRVLTTWSEVGRARPRIASQRSQFNRFPPAGRDSGGKVVGERGGILEPIDQRFAVVRERQRDEASAAQALDRAQCQSVLQLLARCRCGQHQRVVLVGLLERCEPPCRVKCRRTRMTSDKVRPSRILDG